MTETHNLMSVMFSIREIYRLYALQTLLIQISAWDEYSETTHLPGLTYSGNFISSEDKVAFHSGDVIFGGLFAIHIPGENGQVCGKRQQLAGLWVESMLYAVQNVNDRDDILPGVKVGYDIKDDCSDPNTALEHALSFISVEGKESCSQNDCGEMRPPTVGVIGTGASTTSVAVADLLGLFHIPQVSYSATSTLLSDKMRFPFFLRTMASDNNQARVMADLTARYGWNYVIILHTKDDYGIPGIEALKAELKPLNVCIEDIYELSRHTTDYEVTEIVRKMKYTDKAEVIFTFCLKHDISRVLDEAVKQDLKGRTWIASDSWGDSIQTVSTGGRGSIVEGMLGIVPQGGVDDNFTKYLYSLQIYKYTKNPWYKDTLGDMNNCTTSSNEPNTQRCHGNETFADVYQKRSDCQRSSFVIDAVYALAYGLHDYLECWNGECNLDKLQHMDMEEFLVSVRNVTFLGTNGEVFYFKNGNDPVADYAISNLERISENKIRFNKVGDWSETFGLNLNSEIHWSSGNQSPFSRCSCDCLPGFYKVTETPSCCWTCIKCQANHISNVTNSATCTSCNPGQRTNNNQTECITMPIKYIPLTHPISVTFNITAGLCLLATATVFCIFIKKSNTPIVKATSIELSYCLLIFIALCYANVSLVLQKPSDFICNAVVISVGISFSAFVGTLITKTNRISRIFNRKLSAGSPSYLSIKYQILIIASIVGIQAIIQMLWVWIEPAQLHLSYSKNMTVLECNYGSYAGPMATVVYVLILALYCSYLAFRIRKLPGQFNDSKAIFFSILTTALVWVSFFPAYFKSGDKMRIIVCSLALILNSTIALSSLFVPKLWIILFEPEKNRRESTLDYKEGCCTQGSLEVANFSKFHATNHTNGPSHNRNFNASVTEKTPLKIAEGDLDEETFQKQMEELQNELCIAEERKSNALSRVAELKRILEELEKENDSIYEL